MDGALKRRHAGEKSANHFVKRYVRHYTSQNEVRCRHRWPNLRDDRGVVAPSATRNALLALRAFGERLAVLPTAATIRVPIAPPAAAPVIAAVPAPAAVAPAPAAAAPAAVPAAAAPAAPAPPNLLDLSSGIAVRDDRGRRPLCDDAWQGKCRRAGGYGCPAKEQSAPRKAQKKWTFQHVKFPSSHPFNSVRVRQMP
jgi:hypothetical protein